MRRKQSSKYRELHTWIVKNYGKANHCVFCDTTTAKRYDWANISGEYKKDINDYIQLCRSCHIDYDKNKLTGNFGCCVNGHKLTSENIYYHPNGYPECKTCKKERLKKYRLKKKGGQG
jgi:hypothetical protein